MHLATVVSHDQSLKAVSEADVQGKVRVGRSSGVSSHVRTVSMECSSFVPSPSSKRILVWTCISSRTAIKALTCFVKGGSPPFQESPEQLAAASNPHQLGRHPG